MSRARDRLAVVLLTAASACGGGPEAKGPVASAPARAEAAEAAEAAAPEPAVRDALPSLDALAARGPSEAPLMREALRAGAVAPRSPEVRAEKDVCLRAVFASSAAVRASFADESGAMRGEPSTGASGTVPPRGPVCVRKGEALHLVLESVERSAAPHGRAVIFAAP